MKHFLFLLLLSAAVAVPALAQPAAPATSLSAGPAPKASHLQAALTLLDVAYAGGKSFDALIDQMLEAQLKPRPELRVVEPEMRAFFTKYMGWQQLRPEMAAIYVREFSETELRDITRFYQTPTGQKMNTKLPQLMQAGMELGQRRVQEHLPELQQAMEAKLKPKE